MFSESRFCETLTIFSPISFYTAVWYDFCHPSAFCLRVSPNTFLSIHTQPHVWVGLARDAADVHVGEVHSAMHDDVQGAVEEEAGGGLRRRERPGSVWRKKRHGRTKRTQRLVWGHPVVLGCSQPEVQSFT